MLVLGRKPGQRICIGDDVEVVILGIRGARVRLGIVAPPTVTVLRSELSVEDRKPVGTSSEYVSYPPRELR